MGPLARYIVHEAMYEVHARRSLGSTDTTDAAPALTASQSRILQCLALSFSTVSVASAILAFYWFMKMQRIFRHEYASTHTLELFRYGLLMVLGSLVMLLIQSDMFKALWFMIFPIVTFISGPVASNSRFCQVNGFFITIGIEASGTG